MARIALALPVALEDRISDDALRHGHDIAARSVSALELASLVGSLKPDIVIASSEPRYLTDRVLAACDDAGVRIIALATDDAARRHAATLGLYESLDAASPWPEIEAVIDGARREPAPKRRRAERGSVIAVWGPSGSPGRTTIAISIAAELASLGHTVALADVDTHGASIAPALGMLDEAPGFAAACRLAGTDTLTHLELERIAQRYESALGGFWVLTGIGRPSRWPELSGERVAATIRQCRTWVDYTILDTSSSLENDEEISSDLFAPRRNAAAVTAVHEADSIVAVGSADPVGLSRFLRAHVDMMETASTSDVTVVMNRIRDWNESQRPGDPDAVQVRWDRVSGARASRPGRSRRSRPERADAGRLSAEIAGTRRYSHPRDFEARAGAAAGHTHTAQQVRDGPSHELT